ncbi:hypothetical protein ACROYT_G036470 [Oculina patagonica]
MCKRSRKPPVLATQNAPPTGVAREATNTTHATEHELQQGNSVSNGATVIAVAELNEVSPPLPPGAPPPYSSLENAEPELPPPSYDEAVRNNSTMALVVGLHMGDHHQHVDLYAGSYVDTNLQVIRAVSPIYVCPQLHVPLYMECDGYFKCCQDGCTWRYFRCSCVEDTDCSSKEICYSNKCVPCDSSLETHPNCPTDPYSSSPAPTSSAYKHPDSCVWDSDCEGSSVCKGGQCQEVFGASGSLIVPIICLVAVAVTLLILYHMCRKKSPGVVTQNTGTTRATDHEMQQRNAVSNGAAVIEVQDDSLRPLPVGAPPPYTPPFLPEINAVYDNGGAVIEVNEDSSVLHPGAPPPYSSLELEGQQNVSDEPEQAPPSYDEAVRTVRNSATL